jgi:hypothetical protein
MSHEKLIQWLNTQQHQIEQEIQQKKVELVVIGCDPI